VHVSISKLGSKAGKAAGAAKAVVEYLTGEQDRAAGQRGAPSPELTADANTPGSYYADSARSPGRWHGQGAEQMIPAEARDHVDAEMLERVLLGQHPVTGEQLVGATGSAGRAAHRQLDHVQVAATGEPGELLSAAQTAKLIGVDESYVKKLARDTVDKRLNMHGPSILKTYLDGRKVDNENPNLSPAWRFERGEVERFIATRKQPDVVLGYDITYSVPKSVSIAWAAADEQGRGVIEEALHGRAVGKAMDYLESDAIAVRRGRGQERGNGMIAASFIHDTNRELEPQLHVHVVVGNMATAEDGRVQALDARGIYAHGGTSGHLAEAELQSILNQHGYQFGETHKGIGHLVDVPKAAVDSLSTRRAQIMEEVAAVGADSPAARQMAAYATRAAKDNTVDAEQLTGLWLDKLADVGMGPTELAALTNHDAPLLWTPDDTRRLQRHLSSREGVTEKVAIFDRRDVICAITDHAGGRLSADAVLDQSDLWLRTNAVIPLQTQDGISADLIGSAGKVSLTPGVTYYTTPQMIRVEQGIKAAYLRGHDIGAGTATPSTVDRAIARWEHQSGHTLGEDQADMVRAITSSGDRFQAVIGPAGAGKTAALEVAARAWEHQGYEMVGISVNGNASQVMQRATGIESTTVAGFLRRHQDHPVAPNTVIVVDEASTLGNRQHHDLVQIAERDGATVRTIGDPAQHRSVEAGGMWAHLTQAHPERVPALTENRRMDPETMADVRLAVAEYRQGKIGDALARLADNERVVTAATSAELLDDLATDWYVDWQRHITAPDEVKPSRMMAEGHAARRELNTRAQTLLIADGTLGGPGVQLGDSTFYVGDQVIARSQNRNLKPDGGDRKSYVRNGTKGTVVAIEAGPQPTVTVDFEHRGRIEVPHEWLTKTLRPGVEGGLTPAYAMTTHAAQGDTFSTAHPLITDRSSAEGVYVALTRGESDLRTYSVDAAAFADIAPPAEHGLPVITDERTIEERIEAQLTKAKPTDLATEADNQIADVFELLNTPLRQLDQLDTPAAQRAVVLTEELAFNKVLDAAPAPLVAVVGHRGDHVDPGAWDQAAYNYAVYNQRWNLRPTEGRIAPLPQPGAPASQRLDYTNLTESVIEARAQRNAELTPAQLAPTRANIVTDLKRMRPRDNDADLAAISRLKQRVTNLQGDLHAQRKTLDQAATPRNRTTDPNRYELARRQHATTQTQLDVAKSQLADMRAVHVAGPITAQSRERSRIELAVVDTIIDKHAASAMNKPQDYRTDALGPRPKNPDAAKQWDTAATTIERYRIGQLGRGPESGPVEHNADQLAGAIGTRPSTPDMASHWDQVAKTAQGAQTQQQTLAATNALRIGR